MKKLIVNIIAAAILAVASSAWADATKCGPAAPCLPPIGNPCGPGGVGNCHQVFDSKGIAFIFTNGYAIAWWQNGQSLARVIFLADI